MVRISLQNHLSMQYNSTTYNIKLRKMLISRGFLIA